MLLVSSVDLEELPVRVSPTVQVSYSEDGAALLDAETGKLHTLNRGAALIWRALSSGMNVDAAVRELVRATGEVPAVVGADVCDLVEQLTSEGLLR